MEQIDTKDLWKRTKQKTVRIKDFGRNHGLLEKEESMKTIKVTANNRLSIIDVNFDDYRDIKKAVGCECFETVKTQRLFDFFGGPVLFCVDESGLLKDLPINWVASFFYGTGAHGSPIVGDIVFGIPVYDTIEAPKDVESMKQQLLDTFGVLREE